MFQTAQPLLRRPSAIQFINVMSAIDFCQQPPCTMTTTGNGPAPSGSQRSTMSVGPSPQRICCEGATGGWLVRSSHVMSLAGVAGTSVAASAGSTEGGISTDGAHAASAKND